MPLKPPYADPLFRRPDGFGLTFEQDTDDVRRSLDMSFSLTRICNMALGQCGITKPISAMEFAGDESVSQEAMLCAQYFELAFRSVARAHDWKCLTAQADISGSLTTTPAFGFAYSYSLPADCIRVLAMSNPQAAWKVVGRTLQTDETEVLIEYVQYTLNTDVYDPLFVEALSKRLAAYLAPALCGEKALAITDALIQWNQKIALPNAQWADAAEAPAMMIESSTWRQSRL